MESGAAEIKVFDTLESYRDTEYVYSIHRKRLSGDMIDLSGNLKSCMNSHWEEKKSKKKPVIDFLNIAPGHEMADILYYEKEID